MNNKKYLWVVIIIIGLILASFVLSVHKKEATKTKQTNISIADNQKEVIAIAEQNKEAEVVNEKESSKNEEDKIPEKILIDVPFTSQAPFAKWDELHEEACEEASIIMIKYFLDKKELTPQIAEKEIQDLVKFEIKKYGDYKDSDAKQTAKIFTDFYDQAEVKTKLKVIYDFKKEDIKKYLSYGKPIIVPAAGRLLKNPNFTLPGPLYHNLILVGYEGESIITNDPGTRRGKGYTYNLDVLYKAIHDFTGQKEDIEKGRKAMIILE